MGLENPVHLIFIAAVALIVLGPKRLPEIARALGHGIREFRESVSQPPASQVPPPTPYVQPTAPQAPPAPHVQPTAPDESAGQHQVPAE
jgi:TatA/E family protein of Tat protein translocase